MDLYAFRRNLVVAASAGTGKTHSLVGVLLHLLLGLSELGAAEPGKKLHAPVDPSRVVATTFSRKAAAEIRGRLAGELERLALAEPSLYRPAFDAARTRVGLEPLSTRELATRARRTLERLGHAQIGTLHSFAATLVRAHALELGLPPDFTLGDEDAVRSRAAEVVGETLAAYAVDEPHVVRDLVRISGNVDRAVETLLGAIGKLEEDGRGAERLFVADDDATRIAANLEAVVAHARALLDDPKCKEAARPVVRAWDAGDELALEEALPELFALRNQGQSELAQGFFALRERLLGEGNKEKAHALLRTYKARHLFEPRGRAARDLLAACERAVRRDRQRRGELAFGDVLRAARDLLLLHPLVAAEVSSGLDALLVDEFQDTSRLQRELVELLWEKNPKTRAPGTSPGVLAMRGSGLFVVGDRKQSIYGFRGADVGVFAELCVGLAGRPARVALGIPDEVHIPEPKEALADFVPLQHNRRGEDELLTFANAFSARMLRGSGAELFAIRYVPETEDLRLPPEKEAPREPRARTTWLRPPMEKTRTSPLEEAFAIADRVRKILDEGAPSVRGRPPTPRDIAVLAQTNGMLETCAYTLAAAKIPYVVAGRGFYSSREVLDVVAFLALVVRPHDRVALLTVLRGPWAGVSDEALLALAGARRALPEARAGWDAELTEPLEPEDHASIARVVDVVERLRRNVDRLSPETLLREAVRELELLEVLLALPRGAQRAANVEKLFVIARRETDATTLLERLEAACERDAMETEAATFSEEDDAVRLLTVHASKGLDFPIVFVPEIGAEPPRAASPSVLVDLGAAGEDASLALRLADTSAGRAEPPSYTRSRERERARLLAERARLAYVAITRASEAMYLVGDRKAPKQGGDAAFRATIAGVLDEMTAIDALRVDARLAVEHVERAPVLSSEGRAPLAEPPALVAIASPPAWGTTTLAATSLQDFHHCPRRFQLVHLLDLPERDLPAMAVHDAPRDPDAERAPGTGDGAPTGLGARAEGTLTHRVLEVVAAFGADDAQERVLRALETEGLPASSAAHRRIAARAVRFLGSAYACDIAARGATTSRELPFVLPVSDAGEGGDARTLVLRGTMDLVVVWPDGAVDVVDYKRARGPSIEPHAFQLAAYALAARALYPEAPRVRAGIVFLGGDAVEPRWQEPVDPRESAREIVALARSLATARWTEAFPRVAPERCKRIHCGYIAYCHPSSRVTQLPLFRG